MARSVLMAIFCISLFTRIVPTMKDGRAVSLIRPGGDVSVSGLVATRCTCDDGNTANGTAAMRNAASSRAGLLR